MSILPTGRAGSRPVERTPVILLEHPDLIAVDKPAGLASIPEREASQVNLVTMLSEERHERLFVVHRLDKEVSGVIVFARTSSAHTFLNGQFSARKVRKLYAALVHGRIAGTAGVVDAPLRQFGSGRVGVDAARGKPCSTEYAVVHRFDAATLLEVSPLTGRRHQIRAHLYSTGHPVVGDLRYGDRAVQSNYPRLMLHARQLSFHSPSGGALVVEAPVPEEFLQILAGFGPEIP